MLQLVRMVKGRRCAKTPEEEWAKNVRGKQAYMVKNKNNFEVSCS
jgi:hypothetical protein